MKKRKLFTFTPPAFKVIFIGLIVFLFVFVFLLVAQRQNETTDQEGITPDNSVQENIFTHIASDNLAFKSFKLIYPATWHLVVNEEEIKDSNYTGKSPLFLYLKSCNSSIKIVSAAFGTGGCLFPGPKDTKAPYGRYGEYKDIRVEGGEIWRRAESLNQKTSEDERYTLFRVCYGNDNDGYSSVTPIGGIEYRIYGGEEALITEFDKIVQKIKVL